MLFNTAKEICCEQLRGELDKSCRLRHSDVI